LGAWSYHNPVDITFGWGVLSELPRLLNGRRAVVVTFPQAKETGLFAQLHDLLGMLKQGLFRDNPFEEIHHESH